MEEILHQLSLVVYPMINKALYIPGGCFGFLPSIVPFGGRLGSWGPKLFLRDLWVYVMSGEGGSYPQQMCNLTHDMKANRVAQRLISLRVETIKPVAGKRLNGRKPIGQNL